MLLCLFPVHPGGFWVGGFGLFGITGGTGFALDPQTSDEVVVAKLVNWNAILRGKWEIQKIFESGLHIVVS